MISIEEVEEMLDEIAGTLPQEFYNKLNGGILLLPEAKRSQEVQGDSLYILGQYHCGGHMGRYISIFYGSFIEVFGHVSKETFYKELKKTLIHEFTHHIESLAGEDTLTQKDKIKLQEYRKKYSNGG